MILLGGTAGPCRPRRTSPLPWASWPSSDEKSRSMCECSCSLAIIDDIIAVLIIAFFYTESLQWGGFVIAAFGILGVLAFQRIGIGAALPYVVPGLLIWGGSFVAGIHPTLAGVVLGLMTPARPLAMREPPLDVASRALGQLKTSDAMKAGDPHLLQQPLRDLRVARREILPPVSRVQMALHP